MTLSLFAVTKGLVVQVSDRLLTLIGNSSVRPDTNSNKSLVYEGDGVRMLVSYTGLAYIGDKPTDHFIAEALAGHPIETGVMSELGGRRKLGDLSTTARRLVAALNTEKAVGHFAACSRNVVALVGWCWSRNLRLRPFGWAVTDDRPDGLFRIAPRGLPRYWPWDRQVRFIACPNPSPRILHELASVGTLTVNELAEKMVGLIRSVSAAVPTVGRDCLVTTLVAGSGEIRHRFVTEQHEAQYTPWVITRSGILHPSEVTGSGLMSYVGGLNVCIEGPLPTTGGNAYSKPQSRTRAPRAVSRTINRDPNRG